MLRVKAYNNGNKTLLYSVETYRIGTNRYFAVTSDEMKRVVVAKSGEIVSMVRPLSEGSTRLEAMDNLQTGIKVMCGVEPSDQSFIAVRHHDEWACYFCKRLQMYDNYDEWHKHFVEVHNPSVATMDDLMPMIKLHQP